jgi:hypothetical protein
MPSLLLDTGVWYALCDPADRTRPPDVVKQIDDLVSSHPTLVPWPIAYESLRTRLVRNTFALSRFEQAMKSPRIRFVGDDPYRQAALELSLESSLRRRRPLSMVDCMMRLLLEDVQAKVSYLVTFNERDFVDVCASRRVEIWFPDVRRKR